MMLVNAIPGQRIKSIPSKAVGELARAPVKTGRVIGYRGSPLIDIRWDPPASIRESCVYPDEIEAYNGLDEMLDLL